LEKKREIKLVVSACLLEFLLLLSEMAGTVI